MLVGAAGLTLLVGVHLVLSAPMRVPIIHPDELGYLENARFLARGGLRSETEYYPGFSLLLVPLWWMSRSPGLIYRQTLDVEAVLGALGAWLTWRLTPHVAPNLAGWRRLTIVGLVSAYPPFLLYGDFALAETTFVVMFALVVLSASAALPTRSVSRWIVLGVTSGLLAMVHPRGLAVMVAAGLMGLLVLGVRRSNRAPLGGLLGGLVATLAVTHWLANYVKGPLSNGFTAYRPDGVISKSLSLHGAWSLVAELAGQLFYLSLASFGLVPVALALGGRALWRVLRGERAPRLLSQAFVTLCFLGVWALSSMFMNLGDRADKLIYGRYNEGVIVPLLVMALADLLGPGVLDRARHVSARRTRSLAARRWLSLGIVTIAVTALFVGYGHPPAALRGNLNPVNVLALAPVLIRMRFRLDPLVLAALGIATVTLLALVSRRSPLVAIGLIAAVFAASVIDTETGYIVPGTRARAAEHDIATAIIAVRRDTSVNTSCIGYDADQAVDYNYYNDRFLLPGQRFVWFDGQARALPCGTLVVSRRPDFATLYPSARLIVTENYLSQSLWAVPRPGDDGYEVLSDGGWLAPASPTAATGTPLPEGALSGSVLSIEHAVVRVGSGGSADVIVTVAHRPGGAPWPDAASLHSGTARDAVQLATRWFASGDPLAHPGDPGACPSGFGAPVALSCPPPIDLPSSLLPGQRVRIRVRIEAVDSAGHALRPGPYVLHFGLLQQGVASFTDPPLEVPVTVGS